MDTPSGDLAGKHRELKFCCGQLVTSGPDPGHIKCDGICLGWVVETLTSHHRAHLHLHHGGHFANPLLNLTHQDSHHHGVVAELCGVCRGAYVSEGAFIRHVAHGHSGPSKFDQELDQA